MPPGAGPGLATGATSERDRHVVGRCWHPAPVPLTLFEVERAVRAAWSPETAYASAEYLARAPDRPGRGQCGTTALVVHDLLGGELLVAPVQTAGGVDGVHYWNRLDDGDVDLTRGQFADDEVVLEPRTVPREPLPRPEAAQAAYLLLRERVFSGLNEAARNT